MMILKTTTTWTEKMENSMRKIYVEVKTRLIIQADEDVSVDGVLENMDYNFNSKTDGADIVDTEIQSWVVTDSK